MRQGEQKGERCDGHDEFQVKTLYNTISEIQIFREDTKHFL